VKPHVTWSDEPPLDPAGPVHLVVVGAADGIGRWLCRHLLNQRPWDSVTLIDRASDESAAADRKIAEVEAFFSGGAATFVLHSDDGQLAQLEGARLGEERTAVCIAVPQKEVANVGQWLLPALAPDAVVFDNSSSKVGTLATLAQVRTDLAVFGFHPLFGPTTPGPAGQSFVFCPSWANRTAHSWLADLVRFAGGLVSEMTAERHDMIMSYIQTATHQSLLLFTDVVGMSGFDLDELWAFRTPMFEGMLSLATRVIAPVQERTSVSIELTTDGARINAEYAEAVARLRAALLSGEQGPVHDHFRAVRDRFSGSFFLGLQHTAADAIDAMQVTRTRLAEKMRTNSLVGLRSLDSGEIHCCRIIGLSSTTLTIRDVMTGPRPRAGLLHTPAAERNARKLGLNGKARKMDLSLGRVRMMSDLELESHLDLNLGRLKIDLRVIIPESVSGEAAARLAGDHPLVTAARVRRQEARLGQREVILDLDVRCDADLDVMSAEVRARIEDALAPPPGILGTVRAAPTGRPVVGFLGPLGTFSDQAAEHLRGLLAPQEIDTSPQESFSALLEALDAGELEFAVMPIVSSSSGLVDSAARALLEAKGEVRAVGIVDVPIRFDAFGRPEAGEHALAAGARCLSHDQALRQCAQFLRTRRLEAEASESTVRACEEVRDGGGVALAGPGIGQRYGLVRLASDVGDISGALTRFLVLGRPTGAEEPLDGSQVVRSLCLGDVGSVATALAAGGTHRSYTEVIAGGDGIGLLVSTDLVGEDAGPGLRWLGAVPWSPPTAIVRPA
jgi:prephenate dehydratase/prephenate dehydrogenase